jgi:hypothetical protein
MISQSSVMVGAITIGYVLFIIQKGELGSYLSLLKGNSNSSNNSLATAVTSPSGNAILNAANTGQITNNPLPPGTILPNTTPATGDAQADIFGVYGSDEPTQQQIDDYVNGN